MFYLIIRHQITCMDFSYPPSGVLVILQRGVRPHLPGLYQRGVSLVACFCWLHTVFSLYNMQFVTKCDLLLALQPEVQVKFRKWRFSVVLNALTGRKGAPGCYCMFPFSTALPTNSVLDFIMLTCVWGKDLIMFPIECLWRVSRPSRSVEKMNLCRSRSRISALLPAAPQTHVIFLTVEKGTAGMCQSSEGPRPQSKLIWMTVFKYEPDLRA